MDDAQRLINFALETPYIKLLSIWSINADKTSVNQQDTDKESYFYSKLYTTYESYNDLLSFGQYVLFLPVLEPAIPCISPPRTTTTTTTAAKPLPTSNNPPPSGNYIISKN